MHYLFTHQLLYHISEAKLNKLPKRNKKICKKMSLLPHFSK